MTAWNRFVTAIGPARFISLLGGLYVVLAAVQAGDDAISGGPLGGVLVDLVLLAVPGLVLLYSGLRLPELDVDADVHSRIVSWCLGGFGAMLTVASLLLLDTVGNVDRPLWVAALATALGSIGGLVVGLHEARAVTRARAAERQNRDLQRYERLIEESTDLNAILGADGTFKFVTRSVEHVLGYDPDELVGDEAAPYLHPDDREGVVDTFDSIAPGERSPTVEFRFERADGSWAVLEGRARNLHEDPAIGGIVVYTHDVTARRHLEDDLRQERDLRERIVETSPVGILVLTREADVAFLNVRGGQLLGRTKVDLNERPDGAPLLNVVRVEGGSIPDEDRPLRGILSTGEPIYDVEFQIARPDGERVWLTVNAAILTDESGATERVVFTFEDVTERKRYNSRLVSLNELSQDLTGAESEQAVCDTVVEAARETLPLDLVTIQLYDEEGGQLRPVSRTAAVEDLVGNGLLFESDHDVPWQVYGDQTRAVFRDLREEYSDPGTPVRSAIIHPLGQHGVFICGSTTPGAFGATDESVAQMLVATTRAALDQVDREATLRERRDELEAQNTALERLHRLNEIIRGITKELIQSSTREEIVQAVCDRLAASDAYRFVWIGSHDVVTDEVTPEAWSGIEDGYLDAITVTVEEAGTDREPAGRAVRTHETQIQNTLSANPPFEPWRQAALERGYRASIAVPLVYGETLYGVLDLYADQPEVFDEMEASVLSELGETIGYAMNALERKQALVSERSVELEFQLREGEPLFQFATDQDCEFEYEDVVHRADGSMGIFFSIRGLSPDEVLAYAADAPNVEDVTLVREQDDGALYEFQLSDSSFLSMLIDHGAVPRTLTTTGDQGHAVIRVPRTSKVRMFVDLFETQYDEVDLVGRGEVDEPIRTRQEFEAEFRARLTDRQEEILRKAYLVGFFDSPREISAQGLAEALGVSQPTVSRHIRAGERKLFDLVFGEE